MRARRATTKPSPIFTRARARAAAAAAAVAVADHRRRRPHNSNNKIITRRATQNTAKQNLTGAAKQRVHDIAGRGRSRRRHIY